MITTCTFRSIGAAALLAAAAFGLLPVPAYAGECPADKVAAGAMQPGATEPKGVTDKIIASIDLAAKAEAFKGHLFRMRQLDVAPGGVVPWHSHAERPALIYIVSGEVTEYRSTCSVPILHKAGEVVAEFGADIEHWWRNNSDNPTVLISADVFSAASTHDHPM